MTIFTSISNPFLENFAKLNKNIIHYSSVFVLGSDDGCSVKHAA